MGRVRNLSCFTSDHCPILLTLDSEGEKHRWKRKPFRFEAMWLTDLGCHHTVSRAWESNSSGAPMFRVMKKLKKCKMLLKKWSKAQFGSVLVQIRETKMALWKAEENAMKGGDYQEVIRLKSKLNFLLDREEQMWHQRAHVKWVQCGDKNTKFFYGTATQQKRRNFIKGLLDDQGVWNREEEVVSALLVDYYGSLFTSSNPHNPDSVLEGVQLVVIDDMNPKLVERYTAEEVATTIKEMASLKASALMVCHLCSFRLTGWT